MDDYMNQGIRKVIESCPPVGDILDHYSIGCVQCADGSCRMGDILKFHPLPPEQQTTMMGKIEEAFRVGAAS